MGIAVVIVAPSGAGKSTLIKKLKADFPNFVESISYTTRAPRSGEKDGVNYFFIDKERFQKMIKSNAFIEWANVHSHYYGTSKQFVEEQLRLGKNLLFDIDIQGADELKIIFKEKAQVIFIEPPSEEELESRLRNRGTDGTDVIKHRIENAKKELKRKNDYDFLVMNDDLTHAYAKLRDIVKGLLD